MTRALGIDCAGQRVEQRGPCCIVPGQALEGHPKPLELPQLASNIGEMIRGTLGHAGGARAGSSVPVDCAPPLSG